MTATNSPYKMEFIPRRRPVAEDRWMSSRIGVVARELRQAVQRVVLPVFERQRPAMVVDLGCGDMPYREILAPLCGRYVGADLAGNDKADVVWVAGSQAPFEVASVDVVVSTQVLEHVPDPAAYLTECHRLLRSDGLLVLSTHGTWRYHPDPNDFWRWTRDGLTMLVTSNNFKVESITGALGPVATGLQLVQDGLLPRFPAWTRPLLIVVTQCMMRLAERFCWSNARDREAAIFLVLARKHDSQKEQTS